MDQASLICPGCGKEYHGPHCDREDNDAATKPEPTREETLRSSDWVEALEAALLTIKNLRDARSTKDGTEWAMRAGAQECLEWLVANERSRGATESSSPTREGPDERAC